MSASKGWRGNLRIADTEAGLDAASNEGYIDDVGCDLDGGLDELFQLGSRLAQEILEGNVRMGLSVTKRLVDKTWAEYAGAGQTDMLPPERWVGLYPLGYASGKPKFTFRGKFGSWSLSTPQDGAVTESLDFVVEEMKVGVLA